MIGRLIHPLMLAAAVVAVLFLSFHVMALPVAVPADAPVTTAQMAHGDHRGEASDPIGQAACVVHCFATAALPAEAAEARPSFLRLATAFGPPTRLSGLVPPPLGPPPKAFASL